MIEKSLLTENIIKKVVNKKYGIEIKKIKKVARGSANIYKLNNDIILKEFQSKYKKEDIEKEIKILNALREVNLNVPKYIKTFNGKSYFIHKNRIIILQKFIKGYIKEPNTGNQEQIIESAKILGLIVKGLAGKNIKMPISDITEWYSEDTIKRSIKKFEDLIKKCVDKDDKKIKEDLEEKIKMLKNIKDVCDFEKIKKITISETHGDYSVQQFIYNKSGKIAAVIDFVSTAKMPIIWEIIRSYSYIDKEVKNGEINIHNLVMYVKEFTQYYPLNYYDIKYLPYLYLIQLLCSSYGYKQYLENKQNKKILKFAIFRTNLARSIYKKGNEISENLIKYIWELNL